MIPISSQLISFVTPLYNEAQCAPELYSRVKKTAESIGMDFELICVDDGSSDATFEILKGLNASDSRVRIVSLSRNFGHQVALTAGLRHSSGDCVVLLDGDLQDPPELVGEMVRLWRSGFQVVYGLRRNRKEGFIRRKCYNLFYRLLSKLANIDLPRDAGDFCLMDRLVADELKRINEYRPYVRGLRAWVGFNQTGVEYARPPRTLGTSKYGWFRLFRLGLDGMISFSDAFLNSAALIGVIISIASLGYGFYIVTYHILMFLGVVDEPRIPGWASIVCSITFLIGVQFIYLGILGKYVGRIFMQTKARPAFVVKELVGFDEQAK